MKKLLFRHFIESGVKKDASPSTKRVIILSNYIALTLATASVLLFFIIPGQRSTMDLLQMLSGFVIFSFPILLNRWDLNILSRIYECWMPPILIFWLMGAGMNEAETVSVATYDGLRYYLLATSSIPYLLLERKNALLLLVCVFPGLITILFCDPILEFFGAGYHQKGIADSGYEFTSVRSIIAYLIINGCGLSLKMIVNASDLRNEKLFSELAEKNKMLELQSEKELNESIKERKQVEDENDQAWSLLNERIKELNALYQSSQILQAEGMSIEDILQKMVEIIPAGWQYPEITAARIVVGPQEFVTPNYHDQQQKQHAEFRTPDGLPGSIEVVYLEEMPEESEGPFLREERNLINMLAEMLRIYLTRKQEADSLKKSEASLNAIINNTTFYIWSVNTKYQLQNCNKPFRQFVKEKFGIAVQDGQSIIELYEQGILMEVFEPRWIELYKQSLAGQSFSLEEEQSGRNFKFSLNPIIENEMVTGVSVFSEETTVLKRKEKELLDANKQIGDLKLMALRAAMNPHFIFNTLNSIQYYIMENDQRKAVNYLSTFSKLIRGILNNSVQTKVKLTDELEMLKHYVTLEQMRFENKFDFVLDVEQDLDIDDIEIPSMLIQPYVENAILHGINNKPGHGKLKISVRNDRNGVVFEVEDDGIGREATKKLHSENHRQHKSFGTALTEERLKIINSQRNVSSEIIDLEKDGKPAGTRVKIWINE